MRCWHTLVDKRRRSTRGRGDLGQPRLSAVLVRHRNPRPTTTLLECPRSTIRPGPAGWCRPGSNLISDSRLLRLPSAPRVAAARTALIPSRRPARRRVVSRAPFRGPGSRGCPPRAAGPRRTRRSGARLRRAASSRLRRSVLFIEQHVGRLPRASPALRACASPRARRRSAFQHEPNVASVAALNNSRVVSDTSPVTGSRTGGHAAVPSPETTGLSSTTRQTRSRGVARAQSVECA